MKTRILAVTLAVLFTVTFSSYAIDRDARFIDSLGIYGLSYKDGNQSAVFLTGETAVWQASDWAIVVGVFLGEDTYDTDSDFLRGQFGIKCYLSELASLTVLADYTDLDDRDATITAVSLSYKQRLISATKGVSPFLMLSAAYRAIDESGKSGNDDEIVGTAGAGCQFMLTDELGLVLEGSYLHSESLNKDGFEMQDGVLGSIYFIAYWN